MDAKRTHEFVVNEWNKSIEKTLCEYISIPNQSPTFDPQWATNGFQEQAVDLLVGWVKEQNVPSLNLEVVKEAGRTPVIFMEVPASGRTDETVLLYGHLDKQPPMTAFWEAGTGPWTPVIKNGRIYGRGGADDGYSIFAAVTAIKALKEQNIPHSRCVIIIEACEESGSQDLPFYIEKLADRIGVPSLVICLDSGCGNYEQFWMTTSLRGLVVGDLKIKVLTEGQHSGAASGVCVETTRVLRQLLDRVEDSKTGKILLPEFHGPIPQKYVDYAKEEAKAVGDEVYKKIPFLPGVQPVTDDLAELALNRTWRPTMCVTGVAGIPALENAGNVLRPETTVKLSFRVPPTAQASKAAEALKTTLTSDPPYGAHVSMTVEKSANGWKAPDLTPWLQNSVDNASQKFYNKPALCMGEGGSIPFMGMLSEKFPGVQFVITGVLGPMSNAHGPNEFLHIDMTQKVICCVASILADHFTNTSSDAPTKKRKE